MFARGPGAMVAAVSGPLNLSLDRAGVAMIVILGLLVAPVTFLAAIGILSHGLDFAACTVMEWVWIGVTTLLTAVVLYTSVRELRGGLGVRMDDEGVRCGTSTLRWSEIEQLDAPAFGLLELRGAGKTLRLRTYLYRERRAVLEFVSRQTGKPVPEILYSY